MKKIGSMQSNIVIVDRDKSKKTNPIYNPELLENKKKQTEVSIPKIGNNPKRSNL
jgi:hypothetical protein